MGDRAFEPDPALGCPPDRPDMIVGEVKEGPARFNAATRDTHVLGIALARFGCCELEQGEELARRLLSHGEVEMPVGHVARMVAFGSVGETDQAAHRWHAVSMSHVIEFLRGYLRELWEPLRHAQINDPALGVLALLEKWGTRAAARSNPGPDA